MTRLTKEEVKAFINKRYPKEKIVDIVMINDEETMALVLTYANTSCVTRYTIDIDSEGCINTWEIEMARFNQIWRRNEL